MNRREFRSCRHAALSDVFPPDAPDVRLSHSALMRAHEPIPSKSSLLRRVLRALNLRTAK
jgi:hypothetical protein